MLAITIFVLTLVAIGWAGSYLFELMAEMNEFKRRRVPKAQVGAPLRRPRELPPLPPLPPLPELLPFVPPVMPQRMFDVLEIQFLSGAGREAQLLRQQVQSTRDSVEISRVRAQMAQMVANLHSLGVNLGPKKPAPAPPAKAPEAKPEEKETKSWHKHLMED